MPLSVAARSRRPCAAVTAASPLITHGIAISSPTRLTAPQRLDRQRLRGIEVAELALDHAQVRGLDGDHELVAAPRARSRRSDMTSRAPWRSPAIWSATPRTWFALDLPSLSRHVRAHLDRLAEQPNGLGGIRVQGDARRSGERERHDVDIPGVRREPAGIGEPRLCHVVVAREEREIPSVVLGTGAARVRAWLRDRTARTTPALGDPLRRDPERHERGRQPVRLLDAPMLEVPVKGRPHVRIVGVRSGRRRPRRGCASRCALLGRGEERVGGHGVHARMIRMLPTRPS